MIRLTEKAQAWAEQEAARTGFPTVEAFIDSLVVREQERGDWLDELIDVNGPRANEKERQRVRDALRERVVHLLDEAVASGPSQPMTDRDWDEIRRQLEERRQQRASL